MSDTCSAVDCAQTAIIMWNRWATAEEVQALHTSGDLPFSENEALIPRFACPDHTMDPMHAVERPGGEIMWVFDGEGALTASTHDAVCTAPPVCDCSVADAVGRDRR